MPDSANEPAPPAATPGPEHRRTMTMIRWLLYLVFVVIGYTILSRLAPVIAPLLVAAGIAYLLDPLVDRLEKKMPNQSRTMAVALLLVAFLSAIGLMIALLVPLIVHEGSAFVLKLPDLVDNGAHWVAERLGFEIPASWTDYLKGDEVKKLASSVIGPASKLLAAAVGGFFTLLGFLAELLLIPVFAFYFLVDWDNILARARKIIPPRHRAEVVGLVAEIDGVVSGWIRGQFTVTAILAFSYAVGFKIVDLTTSGMNLAITIGLIVGSLTIVPFLGTIVGALITALILLLEYHGPGPLIGCGMVFIVLHLLEAAVLTPKIVGHRVGLSEVAALFAVVAGGKLLGITGVLLAVPIAAAIAVLVRRVYDYYEGSEFYGTEEDAALPAWPAGSDPVILERAQEDEPAEAPAAAVVEAPVEPPAEAPVEPPAEAPVEPPAEALVEPPAEGGSEKEEPDRPASDEA